MRIMMRRHKLSKAQWEREWRLSREFAMDQVRGWCGAEDGVDARFVSLRQQRYTTQAYNRAQTAYVKKAVGLFACLIIPLTRHGFVEESKASRRDVIINAYSEVK
jgi:hypothetical protein